MGQIAVALAVGGPVSLLPSHQGIVLRSMPTHDLISLAERRRSSHGVRE